MATAAPQTSSASGSTANPPPSISSATTSHSTPNQTSASSLPPRASSTSSVSQPAAIAVAAAAAQVPTQHAPPPGAEASPTVESHIQPTLPSHHTQTHIAEARTALVASIGNMLDSELQSRASMLHSNATALAKQEHDVIKATEALAKQTGKLAKEAEDAARRVKELGNVQNWAEVLERDFLVLEETVRLARRGGCASSEEGSGSRCCSGCCSRGSWSGSETGDGDGDRDIREDVCAGEGEGGAKMKDGGKESDDEAHALDKGKLKLVEEHVDMMDVDVSGSNTAFSDTSRSLLEAESMNGTDCRAKESETTSLSTTS